MIILENSDNIQRQAESVKAELLKIPGIEAVSFTNCIPTRGATVSDEIRWDGKDATEKLLFWCINSDFDYNKTIKIRMKEGRYFDASFSSDSSNYVINDVAADVMKNQNPLGSNLVVNGKKGVIIGVISDFHTIDLAGPFVPTIIRISPSGRNTMLIKFSSGTYASMTDKIKKIYRQYDPETPLRPKLFRDFPIYSSLPGFSNLNTPSNLIGLSSFIALMLACLGFFGLACFYAESRTKEIGIRKANGATTLSIMKLLLAGYAKWLLIASFIAIPIAFQLSKFFLNRFYFHTSLPLWTFLASPLIACLVAFSTVGLQTWKASTQNPVKSLKYE
jgi:ABC-type antimicrobial peptide transport system permease subunit